MLLNIYDIKSGLRCLNHLLHMQHFFNPFRRKINSSFTPRVVASPNKEKQDTFLSPFFYNQSLNCSQHIPDLVGELNCLHLEATA